MPKPMKASNQIAEVVRISIAMWLRLNPCLLTFAFCRTALTAQRRSVDVGQQRAVRRQRLYAHNSSAHEVAYTSNSVSPSTDCIPQGVAVLMRRTSRPAESFARPTTSHAITQGLG